jgi:hypothetical protein
MIDHERDRGRLVRNGGWTKCADFVEWRRLGPAIVDGGHVAMM